MAKGEFENREREELGIADLPGMGELSEELAHERGDLTGYQTRDFSGGPADMVASAGDVAQAAAVGLGSPKIDFGVRSIYDSRPVNHREFNLWFQQEFGEPPDVLEVDQFRQCFFVPQGMVCVLRAATLLLQPQGSETPLYDGTLAFLVDNAVRDPQDVQVGPNLDATHNLVQMAIPWLSNQPVETFIIADEGQTVGLQLVVNWPTPPEDATMLLVGFTGQFLQKTGVPAQFQIANPQGRAMTAETTTPGELGLSGDDFLVKRRRKKDPFAFIPLLNEPK